MNKFITTAALGTFMLASGCATILNEDNQNINVRTSNNTKVTVTAGGQQVTTPGSISVKRAQEGVILSTDSDKCASTTVVESDVDTVFFVNVLSGGALGSTTDYSTGKMWEYDTDVIINCNN